MNITKDILQSTIREFKDGILRLFVAAGGLEIGVTGFKLGAEFHDPALFFAGGVGFLAFGGLVALTIVNGVMVVKTAQEVSA
jgi:hypothetical protein